MWGGTTIFRTKATHSLLTTQHLYRLHLPPVPIVPEKHAANNRFVLTVWVLYALHFVLYFVIKQEYGKGVSRNYFLSDLWALLIYANQAAWLASLALSVWLITRRSITEKSHGVIVLLLHIVEFAFTVTLILQMITHTTWLS